MNSHEPINEKDIILDSITDGVFTVDKEWRVTSFNKAAEIITGIPKDEAIGQPCNYVFRASICEGRCALRSTMESGEPITNLPIYFLRADGEKVPVSISTALLRDNGGNVIGGVETFRDLSSEEELKRKLTSSYTFSDIISRNHRMKEIFDVLPTIADSPATVLVEGESGTGKELVCRAIHNLSGRADGPFVAVNCGALPDTLLESELFGYRAGAFTDARTDKPGRFALAEGGTILLDEIGDVTPALQVRLLRLLQERVYEPLGAAESVKADVRVLASTNRKLEELVKEGSFRSDLYYRINVVRITIPPLRMRKEDIPLLAEHFIGHFNKLHSREIERISDSALAALYQHDYPGNVRELENAIEHAFVLCRDTVILPEHLPALFKGSAGVTVDENRPATLVEIEKNAIIDALRSTGYNRLAASRALGIHKSTLHRKIKEYGIDRPGYDGRSSSAKE
ncbi:MAG TPA: sigma 54-interacting transcriptional regulator [Anaerolineae bacterium]|nr:sigma 54-interacting transcriptional regulator [Anaerolineae bacterium]